MNDNGLSSRETAAIEKLGDARQKIIDQLAQVIVGQSSVIEELLISLFARGHCLLEGVPGLAKTLDDQHAEPHAESQFQPHPVHPRPHARRHHRHGRDRGEPQHGDAGVPFSRGPAVLPRHPRRRDQPHAAEDAGGAAGGDAGAAGDGGPRAARLVRSVLRAGHAEPHRAGGDLSASRGAARPLHVQGLREVPELQARSSRWRGGPRPRSTTRWNR